MRRKADLNLDAVHVAPSAFAIVDGGCDYGLSDLDRFGDDVGQIVTRKAAGS